jgi:hypothetical protein
MTNTLAYYENPQFTDKKSFITLTHGVLSDMELVSANCATVSVEVTRRNYFLLDLRAQLVGAEPGDVHAQDHKKESIENELEHPDRKLDTHGRQAGSNVIKLFTAVIYSGLY